MHGRVPYCLRAKFYISKTSVSFVSSSFDDRGISLLSLSDKSAVDVVGDLDLDYNRL